MCRAGVLLTDLVVVVEAVEMVSDFHAVVSDLTTTHHVSDVVLTTLVVMSHLLTTVAPGTHSADLGLQLGQDLGQLGGQGHVQGQGHQQNAGLIHCHAMTSS